MYPQQPSRLISVTTTHTATLPSGDIRAGGSAATVGRVSPKRDHRPQPSRRLKRAGLSSSPRRGFWQFTTKGIDFVRQHPTPLSIEIITEIATVANDIRVRDPREPEAAPIPEDRIATPDERLGEALAELRASVIRELRETLAQVSTAFFETIVLDVLHRLCYGANRSDLQRAGGTGDGGIDGVISLDKLGLEKVYV